MRASFCLVAPATLIALLAGCSRPMNTQPMDAGVDIQLDDFGVDAWVPPDAFLADDPGPAIAVFALAPPSGSFFDLPWPSNFRTDAAGHPNLTGFINPHSTLVTQYVAAIQADQVGFATNGTMYFRFSRRVDESTLPAGPMASLDPMASVFLVDVDPSSRTVGARIPIITHYQQLPTVYWPARTLAIRTPDGIPLEGHHTYAAVVTSRVHATDGTAFARDTDFAHVIDGTADARAIAAYMPALTALRASIADVVSLAVFTTEDATGLAMQLRDYVRTTLPAPTATGAITSGAAQPHFNVVQGHFGPVPIFQSGTLPYVSTGGQIDLNDGTIVEGNFNARFAVTIPFSAMPAGGYPIALYSHGTGGDYRSFIQDGTADRLAQIGIAVMGIDQIHHGERNPTGLSPEILFFNVSNPAAVRYNTLESAVDIVSQARFATSIDIPTTLLDRNGMRVRFDASRMYFFGHSQGGLVAPLYLAIDDATRGGVISEGGGLIGYALTLKVQPVSIPQIVRAGLGLHSTLEAEGFTLFHPVATLIQGWIEPSEPSNYAPYLFDHPRTGSPGGVFAPKSIFMTEGGMDPFTPPPSIEALAVAMRIPQLDTISHRIPNEDFLGIAPAGPIAMGNVGGGMATAGLVQFPNEDHFAVFRSAECIARYRGFFMSLLGGGPGTIPGP